MSTLNKKDIAKVKRICRKFYDDLQAVYDEMDGATYEDSEAVQTSVSAQGYAYDVYTSCES